MSRLFRAPLGQLLTIVCAQRVDDPVSPWSSSIGSTNSEVGRDDLVADYALLQLAQAFATENPRLASYVVQLVSTTIGKQTLDNIGYGAALDETRSELKAQSWRLWRCQPCSSWPFLFCQFLA